jgi:hypothetical protein
MALTQTVFKNLIPSSHRNTVLPITNAIALVNFEEVIAAYLQNHANSINIHCGQNALHAHNKGGPGVNAVFCAVRTEHP